LDDVDDPLNNFGLNTERAVLFLSNGSEKQEQSHYLLVLLETKEKCSSEIVQIATVFCMDVFKIENETLIHVAVVATKASHR
jgi:hypothetical protein